MASAQRLSPEGPRAVATQMNVGGFYSDLQNRLAQNGQDLGRMHESFTQRVREDAPTTYRVRERLLEIQGAPPTAEQATRFIVEGRGAGQAAPKLVAGAQDRKGEDKVPEELDGKRSEPAQIAESLQLAELLSTGADEPSLTGAKIKPIVDKYDEFSSDLREQLAAMMTITPPALSSDLV